MLSTPRNRRSRSVDLEQPRRIFRFKSLNSIRQRKTNKFFRQDVSSFQLIGILSNNWILIDALGETQKLRQVLMYIDVIAKILKGGTHTLLSLEQCERLSNMIWDCVDTSDSEYKAFLKKKHLNFHRLLTMFKSDPSNWVVAGDTLVLSLEPPSEGLEEEEEDYTVNPLDMKAEINLFYTYKEYVISYTSRAI